MSDNDASDEIHNAEESPEYTAWLKAYEANIVEMNAVEIKPIGFVRATEDNNDSAFEGFVIDTVGDSSLKPIFYSPNGTQNSTSFIKVPTFGSQSKPLATKSPRTPKQKKVYPVFTPSYTESSEVYVSFAQASEQFGTRQIAPKGKPTTPTSHKQKQKSNRQSKKVILDIHSSRPRTTQSDLNESEEDVADLNDYLRNMKDDMSPEEMEEYLTMMQQLDLSDSDNPYDNLVMESDDSESIDSMDSDEKYWEGDNFDSESSSDFDLGPKSKAPAQFGRNRLNASRHPNSQAGNNQPKMTKQEKKEAARVKVDKRNEKRQVLKSNLEKGEKTLSKLYSSGGGDKYDQKAIEILTKTNKDIHDFVLRSDNDHFTIAPLPDAVRNLVKKMSGYYGLKPKVIEMSGLTYMRFLERIGQRC